MMRLSKKGIKLKTKLLVDTAGLKTITHKDAKQNFTRLSKQIYQIKNRYGMLYADIHSISCCFNPIDRGNLNQIQRGG